MRRWWCVLALIAFAAPGADAADFSLRFIGQQIVPTGAQVNGTVIGGLSGIDYDPNSSRYVAVSDDRSRHSPARFYEVALSLTSRSLSGVRVSGVRFMRQPDGAAYPANAIDAESIRFSGRALLYTSEGNAKANVAPFVREMAADGSYVRSFIVPAHFLPGRRSGIRDNLGFEGLTVSNDGMHILAATEDTLVQDGAAASRHGNGRLRIVSFDRATGEPAAEYVYEIDRGAGSGTAGLSEIAALEGTRYLALERSVEGKRWSVKIFLIDLAEASNVIGRPQLSGQDYRPVSKSLLLDLDTLGIKLDNIEGMTFGQMLENGQRSLILVSDNNFSGSQVTQFLAFAVEPVRRPVDMLLAARETGADTAR